MDNGTFRYVSAGALVLVACSLVIALVGTLSILVANFDQSSGSTGFLSVSRIPAKAAGLFVSVDG